MNSLGWKRLELIVNDDFENLRFNFKFFIEDC